MKLKNLNFHSYVFGQSGVQGFFGEGDEYPHHKFYKLVPGFAFNKMVFVAKTVTLKPRIYPESSNTELREGYKVKRFFPTSVWWSLKSVFSGYILNAVGLANPGLQQMLSYKKWQTRSDAFQISVMLMEATLETKIAEAHSICKMLNEQIPFDQTHQYALQINFSCPNTGHAQEQDAKDIILILKIFREQLPDVALIPKFDLLVEPETIVNLKLYCDAFCIANTIPFGKKKDTQWWRRLFPNDTSPLLKYFNGRFAGGLSGSPLFPVLTEWLKNMEQIDASVVIIAGGGVMRKKDINQLSQFAIVQGIALGSVAILRPWRLQGLITFGNEIFSQKNKSK